MSPLGSEGEGWASELSPSSGSLAAGRDRTRPQRAARLLRGLPGAGALGGAGCLPPPLSPALTVVIQEELGGCEQFGAVLGVRDVQLVEVGLPQLLEVLQRLVAVQQQGGGVLLGREGTGSVAEGC